MRSESLRLAACALALAALFAIVAIAAARSTAAPVVITQDWYVDGPQSVTAAQYELQANLIINASGQFSADHTTFSFMSTTPGQYGVVIKPQGRMVLDSCTFKAGELSPGVIGEAWTFWAHDASYVIVKKCTFMNCGVLGDAEKRRQGVSFETNNAAIRNSTFRDNNIGLMLLSGAMPVIEDNVFLENTEGIEASGPYFDLSFRNEFQSNALAGIVLQNCDGAKLSAGAFVDNTYGIRVALTTVVVANVRIDGIFNGIEADASSSLTVSNSTISTITSIAKAYLHSSIVLLDCDLVQKTAGMLVDTSSKISVRDSCTFKVVYSGADVAVEGARVKVLDKDGVERATVATGADGKTPVVQVEPFYIDTMPSPGHVLAPFTVIADQGMYNHKEVAGFDPGPNTMLVISFDDGLPPNLAVTSPPDKAKYNTTEVLLKGTASDVQSGLGMVYYTLNGGPQQALPAQAQWEARVVLPEGILILRFVARDRSGNEAAITRTITVDITPPRIDGLSPPNGTRTRAYQLLVSGLTEPNANVTIGDQELTVAPNGSFAGNVNLGDEEGWQVLPLRLVDTVGNVGSYNLSVYVDRTPPDLTVETYPDYRDFPILNVSRVIFFGTSEPGARVEVLRAMDVVNSTTINATGGWRMYVPLIVGENDLVVDAYDGAGNRRSFEIITFLYDVTPPEVTIVLPQNGTRTKDDQVHLKARTEPEAHIWVKGLEKYGIVMPLHGEYEIDVPLSVGENVIVVYARDPAGNVNSSEVAVVREGGPVHHDNGGGIDMRVVAVAIVVVIIAVVAVAAILWRMMRRGGPPATGP